MGIIHMQTDLHRQHGVLLLEQDVIIMQNNVLYA